MLQYGREFVPKPVAMYFDKCPFECDGIAQCEHWDNLRLKRTEYFMRCQKCGALGPSKDTEEEAHRIWCEVSRKCALLEPVLSRA